MLNFSLTGLEMHINDILYPVIEGEPDVPVKSSLKRNRHFTYMAEQELLYNVREGNMDTSRALSRASSLSTGVQIQTENPLSQAAITVIIFHIPMHKGSNQRRALTRYGILRRGCLHPEHGKGQDDFSPVLAVPLNVYGFHQPCKKSPSGRAVF